MYVLDKHSLIPRSVLTGVKLVLDCECSA